MAPIHLPLWIGDYARLQQPSSNTGREEQRTCRKQCGHRWVRPCSSLTQARAPSQAQTSHTTRWPQLSHCPTVVYCQVLRACQQPVQVGMWRKEYPWSPLRSDAEELPGRWTIPGAFAYQIKERPQRDAVRASHTLSAIDRKWDWGPSDRRDQSRTKPWGTQAFLPWCLGSLVPQGGTKSSLARGH